MVARQETWPQGCDIVHGFEGLWNAKESHFRRIIQENLEMVVNKIPYLLLYLDKKELNNLGISDKDVPSFIIRVLAEHKIVGIQGEQNDFPRDIYETRVNKKTIYVAISVSKNGYVVGANLISERKLKRRK